MAKRLAFNIPISQIPVDEIKARLSSFIKQLLIEYDISQRKLAGWLGVTVSRLNGYIQENQLPRVDLIMKIADIGGLTVDDLLRTDKPPVIDGQSTQSTSNIHNGGCSRTEGRSLSVKISTPAMKVYIGTKIVAAQPMDKVTFLKTEKGEVCQDMPTEPGYFIRYRDGYISWCPQGEFESTHREVIEAEKMFIV